MTVYVVVKYGYEGGYVQAVAATKEKAFDAVPKSVRKLAEPVWDGCAWCWGDGTGWFVRPWKVRQ